MLHSANVNKLLLPSLKIRNFRRFHDLEIPQLGRVTLVTGVNNVGKTSLLEAVSLYVSQADQRSLLRVLHARDETIKIPTRSSEGARLSQPDPIEALRHFLPGRPQVHDGIGPIEIGPLGGPSIGITVKWLRSEQIVVEDDNGDTYVEERLVAPKDGERDPLSSPFVQWHVGGKMLQRIPVSQLFSRIVRRPSARAVEVNSRGVPSEHITVMWDSIALTDLEDHVTDALRMISPDIERIAFVGASSDGSGIEANEGRHGLVKLKSFADPVPLKSLGDGTNRILAMTLAMIRARDSVLLVDEIENGLHYSVQEEFWNFVFIMATRFNVQVFAVTHSLDCIKSFAHAAESHPELGVLVRLRNANGEVSANMFEEKDLTIAINHDIEVR